MPSKAKPTIKDLSQASGWSLGTVSRVLNRVPGVSEGARQDVLRAARELGYHLNPHARALRQKKEEGALILCRSIYEPYYAPLARLCQQGLEQEGHTVTLQQITEDDYPLSSLLECIELHNPSLLILIGFTRQELRQINGRISIPAICAGAHPGEQEGGRLSAFAYSDCEMMQQAAETLFECGCQSIGLIAAPRVASCEMADRYLGVQYACYSRDQVFRASQAQSDTPDAAGGKRAFLSLIERVPDLDGLLVCTQAQAIGVLRAMADLHIEAGREICVITLEENDQCAYTVPRLSAIHRSPDLEAQNIVTQAKRMIGFCGSGPFFTVQQFSWSVIFRESCPAPSSVLAGLRPEKM